MLFYFEGTANGDHLSYKPVDASTGALGTASLIGAGTLTAANISNLGC